MLFTSAQRRLAREASDDLERATLAVNNGMAILRDPDARWRWESRRAQRDAGSMPTQTAREFTSTLGRLAAMFPSAVKGA